MGKKQQIKVNEFLLSNILHTYVCIYVRVCVCVYMSVCLRRHFCRHVILVDMQRNMATLFLHTGQDMETKKIKRPW